MSTDSINYPYPASPPPTNLCLFCQALLRPGASFCHVCGKPHGDNVTLRWPINQGASFVEASYPLPPAKLTPLDQYYRATASRPLSERQAGAQALPRRPSDHTQELLRRTWREEKDRRGLFKDSGPLPEEILQREAAGAALAAKLSEPPGALPPLPTEMPEWLKSTLKHPIVTSVDITPAFLKDQHGERKSGPAGARQPAPRPAEPPLGFVSPAVEEAPAYPPLPDGKIPCPNCGGVGRDYKARKPGEVEAPICKACQEHGRIQAAIPQPMPDVADQITSNGLTVAEQVMLATYRTLQQESPAADVTGPTAEAETVHVLPQVQQPIGTDPKLRLPVLDLTPMSQEEREEARRASIHWCNWVMMEAEMQADNAHQALEGLAGEKRWLWELAEKSFRQIQELANRAHDWLMDTGVKEATDED